MLLLGLTLFINSQILFGQFGTENTPFTHSINSKNQSEISFEAKNGKYYLLKYKLNNKEFVYSKIISSKPGALTVVDPLNKTSKDNYLLQAVGIDQPLDVDFDGKNDIFELENSVQYSALNGAKPINFIDGAVQISNESTFRNLSFKGEKIYIDPHLSELEHLKFYIFGNDVNSCQVYFINSNTHQIHESFKQKYQLNIVKSGAGVVKNEYKGEIVYQPNVVSPSGIVGCYRFQFQPADDYNLEEIAFTYEMLGRNMPFLKNNLVYSPIFKKQIDYYEKNKANFQKLRMPVLENTNKNINYFGLNEAESYGILRKMKLGQIPNSKDITVYESIPNEISRTAGIITSEFQTPLAHVNLRAIQNKIPNAYIKDFFGNAKHEALINKPVYFAVKNQAYIIRETTLDSVYIWHNRNRPAIPQIPKIDSTFKKILPFEQISFEMASIFGSKTCNLATLYNLKNRKSIVPSGYGIPFYFYFQFMKSNKIFDYIKNKINEPNFNSNQALRIAALAQIQQKIIDSPMPQNLENEINTIQKNLRKTGDIRCRSSTNVEDLKDFSGAGLYDSKTHKKNEGGLSTTIKQVMASFWNERAFEVREFYKVDHFKNGMAITVHNNFDDEKVNGVAVSTDPYYFNDNAIYINSQIGNNLITNPENYAEPEEVIVEINPQSKDFYKQMRSSSLAPNKILLNPEQLETLRQELIEIHNTFLQLYLPKIDSLFAIEIEFKINENGNLVIKQARPWLGTNTSNWRNFENKYPVFNTFDTQLNVFPNPSNGIFKIKYEINLAGPVFLKIIDPQGKLAKTINLGFKSQGNHTETIDLNVLKPSFNNFYLILNSESGAVLTNNIKKIILK